MPRAEEEAVVAGATTTTGEPVPPEPASKPRNGLARSKSSSRFCSLDPVPEASSEDSMDRDQRSSLLKSLSRSAQNSPRGSDKAKKGAGEEEQRSKIIGRSFSARILQRLGSLRKGKKEKAEGEDKNGGILRKGGSLRKLKRAISFNPRSMTRTISSDGAGLLEPIASQTKAFSCNSLNSNGNTDESDSQLRVSLGAEDDGLAPRDPRSLSKHKYFAPPNGDRNFLTKYITPTFHERSRNFRKLFQALVPPDEQMLASYSCAYQREILVQGRMYISSRHFCFYANIFGWGTIFAIPMCDVTELTKERTMGMFPNSIQLSTEVRGRFFFASFTNRDKSLKVMQHAWKQIQSGGEALTPDQLWELMNPSLSESEKEKEREKEREKDSEKKEKAGKVDKRSSKRKKGSASVSSADEPPAAAMLKTVSAPNMDPPSAELQPQPQRAAAGACALDETDAERSSSSSTTTDVSMAECICDDHTGKKLLDQVFPRSPSELFDLIFTSSPWYVQLSSSLKRTGYSASDWATNKEGVRQRTCTYTMALNHAMAPKSCVVTEKQVYKAFPGGYTIVKETVNSGVPYSDSFHVSCTYCVMGYGRGQARLVVHGGLIFSKSVWGMIRGYIERSTTQGLAEHYDALHGALSDECKRSAAGADRLALEDDQNRMDTSSEEGGEADAGGAATLRGMAGSISGINFVHHASTRIQEELCFDLPLLGRVRRVDFYGVGIMALLALMSFTLIVLVLRLPRASDGRLAEVFERYLTPPDSSAPRATPGPDLDSLISAIGRIGAQLQQVRDAAAGNAQPRVDL